MPLCAVADKFNVVSDTAERGADSTMHEKRRKDRRVQKTEALLRDALGALIREKPYNDIVVKEILDRANVGRSTFYTHFRDKDELLLSGIQEMLGSARPPGGGRAPAKPYDNILWFSLPILEHIEQHRQAGEAVVAPPGRRVMHEYLQQAVTELIEEEVRALLRHTRRPPGPASPELLVQWIASTFVLVLNWWVDVDFPVPAREVDVLFHRLIDPSLAELLG
jgi:AcrR family transcriptional regulator